MKKVTIEIKKNIKGFYFSIISSNGNNLNPADPQVSKRSVQRAINSLVAHIQAGQCEIVDTTKIKKNATKKVKQPKGFCKKH